MPDSEIKYLPAAPAAIPALAYIPVQMPDGALVKVAVSALGDFDASITSLIGGEATAFDKVATVGIPTNTVRRLLIGGVLQTYQLRAGADGDVLPEDYHASTNNRSWFQVVAQFEQIVAQAGLSGGGAFSWNGNTFAVLDSTTGAGNIGIHPVIQGSPIFYHTATIGSGIPNGFASLADHSHLKQRILNPNGPANNTAGWSGQLIYTARTDGTSIHNLHGFEAPILFTDLGSEHSISTIGGGTPASPSWTLRVKVRYTASQASLTTGTKLVLRVDRKVAGIEAAAYSGTVVSANALNAPGAATNTWETQIDLFGLDANHWNASQAADVSTQNADWRVQVPQAGAIINDANKVSLARDTAGPTDQLIATWSTAHGLARGENVCVLMEGMTGLTGGWNGFHSGHVEEVRSTTVAVIRVRDLRNIGLRSFSGTAGATSQWAIYRGTRDPDHEVILPANEFTAQRDSTGRVRRVMVGEADVLNDDEWAIGVGGPANVLRGRGGDLRVAGHSLRTMAARDPIRGLRVIADQALNNPLTQQSFPVDIGTGDFTIAVQLRLISVATGASMLLVEPGPTFLIRHPDGQGNMDVDCQGGAVVRLGTIAPSLLGTIATVVVERVGTTLTMWVNGVLVGSGTHANFANSITTSSGLRFGGAYVAAQRHNDIICRAWLCAHRLNDADRAFLAVHGRLPTALQGALIAPVYSSDFSAGTDTWGANGVTLTGNIDGIGGQDNNLRVVVDSSTGVHIASRAAGLPRSKRVRVTADFYRPASNTVVTGVLWQHFNQSNTPPAADRTVQLPADTWTTLSVEIEDLAAVGSNGAIAWYLCNASGAFTFAGNGTDLIYIRNVVVTRLGAIIDLDFGVGVGGQAHDLSGNGFHATLIAPYEHVSPRREGQVRHSTSTSGNTQIAAGIPANARITSITAWAANPVTLSIGTASGGTQIVNAQALNLGLQDVALAGRFSVGGALWVNLSSAVFVRLTISYEIVDSNA